MDAERFDALAKLVSGRNGRRSVVVGLVAGIVGARSAAGATDTPTTTTTVPPARCRRNGEACDKATPCCRLDPASGVSLTCGGDVPIPGEQRMCQFARCAGKDSRCGPPRFPSCCASDPATDEPLRCDEDRPTPVCEVGVPTTTPPCNANLDRDRANCGRCGRRCPTDRVCRRGKCRRRRTRREGTGRQYER